MPTVTLTLIDTPDGRLAVHSDYRPQPGAACSPAQSTALEIMARTRKEWGIEPQTWDRQRSIETPEQLCAELIDFEGLGQGHHQDHPAEAEEGHSQDQGDVRRQRCGQDVDEQGHQAEGDEVAGSDSHPDPEGIGAECDTNAPTGLT